MNDWDKICIEAGRVLLDLDAAEAEMIELETRATVADARAEAAWERFLAKVGPRRPSPLPEYEHERAMGRIR